MQYAVLCYNDEDMVSSWTKEQDQAVMDRIEGVKDPLIKAGVMGPSLRLLPTTAATTVRKAQGQPLVIDGPFAETKEQLLGFYIIDVADLEGGLDVVRRLSEANPTSAYELRPVALYFPDAREGARP
jgi:hypothetical protein